MLDTIAERVNIRPGLNKIQKQNTCGYFSTRMYFNYYEQLDSFI